MSPEALVNLAAISNAPGPGLFLRLVVLGSMVGVCLLAWIMVRAHRDDE
ncbi:hypothetical protein ACIGXM_24265 [Kitasatospora sp. NPDC052896]